MLFQYAACAVVGDEVLVGIHEEKVAAFVKLLALDVIVSQTGDDFVLERSQESSEKLVSGFTRAA